MDTVTFIEKSTQVHKNTYDYTNVCYINTNTPVSIICKHHGEFTQLPRVHIKGHHCPTCAKTKRANSRRLNTTQFIERAKHKHGLMFDYTNSYYINSTTKVIIKCNKCGNIFKMLPSSHLYGQGCPRCGVINTGIKRRSSKERFIQLLKQIYSDRLEYDDITFTKTSDIVTVTCPLHGPFSKSGRYLLDNTISCPICVSLSKQDRTHRPGSYTTARVNRTPTIKAYFYIINLHDDNESFYKVGITIQPLYNRFPKLCIKGYKVQPILVEPLTLKEAFDKEQSIISNYKQYRYYPGRKFNGHTECLSINPYKSISSEGQ